LRERILNTCCLRAPEGLVTRTVTLALGLSLARLNQRERKHDKLETIAYVIVNA